MKVGIDSYSFHRYFGELTKWESPCAEQWETSDFLDYLAENDVTLASLQTSYLDPKHQKLETDLRNWLGEDRSRELLFTWGHPNGLDGGRRPEGLENALDFLRLSQALGANQMRIVLGNHWNFDTEPEERFALLRPLLMKILEVANEYQIRISIENHADFPVRKLMHFIDSFTDPLLGMCLDLGNATRVGDNPITLLQEFNVGSIFMVQVKDVRRIPGQEHPTGWWPTVLFGTGDVDPGQCVQILKSKGFQDPLVIELSNVFTGLTEKEVALSALAYLRGLLAN